MRTLLWLAVVALWLMPRIADANAARGWDPGDPLTEPIARIEHAEIVSEQLSIDARRIAEGKPVTITATYRILSRAALELPLVFVSPGIEKGSVTLDGEALTVEAHGIEALPTAWQSPDTTPDGVRGHLQYAEPIERVLSFRVTMTPGEHDLVVRYDARPTIDHGSTLVAMKLAYVLAAAREWARFGQLDVRVVGPEGWTLSSEPYLKREGDAWRRTFDGVPADALSMTLRPPDPVVNEAIPWVAFVLMLLASAVGGMKAGRRLAPYDGCFAMLIGAFAVGVLGAAAMWAAWYGGLEVMNLTLEENLLARDTDYDRLAVATLGMLLGFVVASGTTLYGRRRANTKL